MPELKTITVVVVSDNHYLPMVAAQIKSIEANLNKEYLLDLWIISDNIKLKNQKKMESSINTDITTINWKGVKEIIPKNFRLPLDKSTFPLSIYLFNFIPYILPPTTEKAIYLDADIINCRDLTELWNFDLGDFIVGAVKDQRIRTFECDWGGILNYQQLGLSGSNKYLNSGVLLINLEKWRYCNITEKALQSVEENVKYAIYPEQYGLNIALHRQWLELNSLWNFFATTNNYSSPYNIHFVDRKPIYGTYKNNPAYRQLFYYYLHKTAWSNFKPIGEFRRYRKKLNNVIDKGFRRFFRVFKNVPKRQSL